MRLALAAVAALALAAAGCGGVESEPNLAQAAEKTETSGSFAFEVANRASDGESFSGNCEGVVDNVRELARVTCDSEAASSFGSFETIMVGDTSYRRHGREEKWTRQPAGENPLDEFSPNQLLELLRSASLGTERVGEEDVRSVPTMRYALTVDCKQAELYECGGETAVVGVWIDDDGLVRRIRVDETEGAFDLEFFDFGLPVEVEAPSADKVVDEPAAIPVPTQPCELAVAEPIHVDEVVEALSRHGFRATAHPRCGAGLLVALVTADRDPGYVHCNVLVAPQGRVAAAPSPEAEMRTVGNVSCSLHGKPADKRDSLDPYVAAMDELERGLRE